MHAHAFAGREGVLDGGDELGIIVEQDVARGGSHEELETGNEGCQHPSVYVRGHSREETVIHMGPAGDDALLVHQALKIGDGRLGIGHIQDAGDPRVDGGQRPCAEILFRRHSGIPEVHMGVHETRQDDPAGAHVDALVTAADQAADGHDPAVAYPDLGVAQLAIDERPSADDLLDIRRNPS